jgi:hypothetical protein
VAPKDVNENVTFQQTPAKPEEKKDYEKNSILSSFYESDMDKEIDFGATDKDSKS